MRLSPESARALLTGQSHGVLCTLHHERGPDPLPVVFATDDEGLVGVPIDRVKAKAPGRLQRETNLAGDPRAALLVERWDDEDWSRLWWVRAHLTHLAEPPPGAEERLAGLLAQRVKQYADRPFDRVIVCRLDAVIGWAAGADAVRHLGPS